jgi:hypothetical protein
MALGDFGGGLLAGIQGAQSASQQRFQRDQDERRTKVYEAADARAQGEYDLNMRKEGSRKILGRAQDLGYMDTSGKMDVERLKTDLAAGNADAQQLILDVANANTVSNPFAREGMRYNNLQKDQSTGRVVLTGNYNDDPSKGGIMTVGGTNSDSDPIAWLQPDQLAEMTRQELEGRHFGEVSDRVLFNAIRGVADTTVADRRAQRGVTQEAVNIKMDESAASGNPNAVAAARQFKAQLADPSLSDDERAAIYKQAAESFGIAIPKIDPKFTEEVRSDEL